MFPYLSLLLEKGFLKNRVDIVCWHDVIINSITPHKSNGNQPLSVEQLLEILRKHPQKFAAIIYCQRFGTPNISDKLRTLNMLIVDVKKKFLSKRKQKHLQSQTKLRNFTLAGAGMKFHHWNTEKICQPLLFGVAETLTDTKKKIQKEKESLLTW